MIRTFIQLCISSLVIQPVFSAVTLNTEVVHTNPALKGDDLVQIHESPSLVCWSSVKHADLAPESRVVGVYFNTASLNILPETLSKSTDNNRSKQSQDFESEKPAEQPSTTRVPAVTLIPVTEPPTSPSTELGSGAAQSTSPDPTTTYDLSLPETTEAPPVGSRVTRLGDAVTCGEANPSGNNRLRLDRIVGGSKTEPGEFPFQVRLNIRSRRGSGICGGVILDGNHILTAAHCMTACVSQHLNTVTIENSGVHATIGDHSIRSSDGEVEVDIENIIPHEKYDACNFYGNDHDIALIKTTKPIEYKFTADGYGSINRPCMPASDATYKDGEAVVVSGWGVTRENSGSLSNILRYVQVPVVNVTRCQETYGTRVTNDHVCAGYMSGGKDSCQGDSGGPLVRVVENRYELVGIVSFGYGCGQPGAPGVYTKVASYVDWIKANL